MLIGNSLFKECFKLIIIVSYFIQNLFQKSCMSQLSSEERCPHYRDFSRQVFPESIPMTFTHGEFPTDITSFHGIGAPLGLMITPFMGRKDGNHL